MDCSPIHGRLWRAAPLRAVLQHPCFTAHASPPVRGILQCVQNSASRHVLYVKSLVRVPSGHTIRAALRAALEKCYNASSPKSWFSPELEPIQVKTTSTLMILGSGPLCPSLARCGMCLPRLGTTGPRNPSSPCSPSGSRGRWQRTCPGLRRTRSSTPGRGPTGSCSPR